MQNNSRSLLKRVAACSTRPVRGLCFWGCKKQISDPRGILVFIWNRVRKKNIPCRNLLEGTNSLEFKLKGQSRKGVKSRHQNPNQPKELAQRFLVESATSTRPVLTMTSVLVCFRAHLPEQIRVAIPTGGSRSWRRVPQRTRE